MAETSQMLERKIGELQAAVEEAQEELSRADRTRRTESHERLMAAVREARNWLGTRDAPEPGENEAAAATRTAEGHLHEIRMRRNAL